MKKDGMCTYGTEFKKFSIYVADTMLMRLFLIL